MRRPERLHVQRELQVQALAVRHAQRAQRCGRHRRARPAAQIHALQRQRHAVALQIAPLPRMHRQPERRGVGTALDGAPGQPVVVVLAQQRRRDGLRRVPALVRAGRAVAREQRVARHRHPMQRDTASGLHLERLARQVRPDLRARERMERPVAQAADGLPRGQAARRGGHARQQCRLGREGAGHLMLRNRELLRQALAVRRPPGRMLQGIERLHGAQRAARRGVLQRHGGAVLRQPQRAHARQPRPAPPQRGTAGHRHRQHGLARHIGAPRRPAAESVQVLQPERVEQILREYPVDAVRKPGRALGGGVRGLRSLLDVRHSSGSRVPTPARAAS